MIILRFTICSVSPSKEKHQASNRKTFVAVIQLNSYSVSSFFFLLWRGNKPIGLKEETVITNSKI